MDVYDHYRFRAIQAERSRKKQPLWDGFLRTDDSWQDGYVKKQKGAYARYFAG
jgi:hypothetical protein